MQSVIIIAIIVIVLIAIFSDKYTAEHMTELSNEAIQGISSVYNSDNLQVTNARVTSNLSVDSELNVKGPVNFLPKGIIVAWSGSQVAVPIGWVLCDGQNETPDLREKFIYGSDLLRSGKTGGSTSYMIEPNQVPPHTHNYIRSALGKGNLMANNGNIWGKNGADTNTSPQHSEEQQPLYIIPPYYTLAYIMRSV